MVSELVGTLFYDGFGHSVITTLDKWFLSARKCACVTSLIGFKSVDLLSKHFRGFYAYMYLSLHCCTVWLILLFIRTLDSGHVWSFLLLVMLSSKYKLFFRFTAIANVSFDIFRPLWPLIVTKGAGQLSTKLPPEKCCVGSHIHVTHL